MRKFAVVGAMMAGLLLSGCAGQSTSLDDGWKLIEAKDYAAARAQYQSILVENPSNPYANLNLGVALEELGDNASAAKHYQVAIANGKDAEIVKVAQDGNVADRSTTVSKVAEENLASLGS
jgi:tetratricopeptide (TPR) repeat protein